jgi:hypothetical protein
MMGYKGKSAAAATGAMALVYGGYFLWARAADHSAGSVFAHMVLAIVLLAGIMVVLETGLAIAASRHRPALQADERDALIAARSARNGYYALLSCLWCAPLLSLSGAPAILTANCILGMMVLAEMVHFGSRVVYDLRGA